MTKPLNCSCGGKLKPNTIKDIDLTPLFGIRGTFKEAVLGLRCDTCKAETFTAQTIEQMLVALTLVVLSQPRILTAKEARYLRKAVLSLTQAALAKRMGINVITIADWERGERPLSKEHDYELRGITLANLLERPSTLNFYFDAVKQNIAHILMSPRVTAPPKRVKNYVVKALVKPAA
ncbi:MAG: helix-turn-helix domain-containing protein [Deltaproteobacteria bacterium]|nr:helix-turn-helix domain-containing protein [Deltaproteobacteria bacterium]